MPKPPIDHSIGDSHILKTHLVADELVITTIDPRTGRFHLRDTGDLAASGRGPILSLFSDRLSDNPLTHGQILVQLRTSVSHKQNSCNGLLMWLCVDDY